MSSLARVSFRLFVTTENERSSACFGAESLAQRPERPHPTYSRRARQMESKKATCFSSSDDNRRRCLAIVQRYLSRPSICPYSISLSVTHAHTTRDARCTTNDWKQLPSTSRLPCYSVHTTLSEWFFLFEGEKKRGERTGNTSLD